MVSRDLSTQKGEQINGVNFEIKILSKVENVQHTSLFASYINKQVFL